MESSVPNCDVIGKVKTFIVDDFLFGDGEQLEESTSFLENGIIDSTGILELIFFLERTFNIEIADDEVISDNLDSLVSIESFVSRKAGAIEAVI